MNYIWNSKIILFFCLPQNFWSLLHPSRSEWLEVVCKGSWNKTSLVTAHPESAWLLPACSGCPWCPPGQDFLVRLRKNIGKICGELHQNIYLKSWWNKAYRVIPWSLFNRGSLLINLEATLLWWRSAFTENS